LLDDNFEDVGLDVFDANGTRVSTSNQTLEVLAGHQQVVLEAMHQLEKMTLQRI